MVSNHYGFPPTENGRKGVIDRWNWFINTKSKITFITKDVVAEGSKVWLYCEIEGLDQTMTSIDLFEFKDGLIISHRDVQQAGTYA